MAQPEPLAPPPSYVFDVETEFARLESEILRLHEENTMLRTAIEVHLENYHPHPENADGR